MSKPYQKITIGYVVQKFDESGLPISQEFVAGDEVAYEDEDGNTVDVTRESYLPFDMVQPEGQEK